MNTRRKRMARLRSASVSSRSRSVTPAPSERGPPPQSSAQRSLIMNISGAGAPRDINLSPSPPPRHLHAFPVSATPGGSTHVLDTCDSVEQTPGGRVRRILAKPPLPPRFDVIERVDALDMSEGETEELMEEAPWHVTRWVEDVVPAMSEMPGMPPKPGAEPVKTAAEQPLSDSLPLPLTPSLTSDLPVTISEVDVQPSTSGLTATSRRTARRNDIGSDLDSEYDDEFDPVGGRDLNMEELEEPIRQLVSDVDAGMDDAADLLLGTSPDFQWVSDFESFRGVREEFSGPTPGPLKVYDTPYDAFIDIWDKDIIGLIVLETNRYAKQTIDAKRLDGTLKPSSRLHSWTDTDEDEIMILFAVYMYMAIDPRTSLKYYWTSNDVLQLPGFKRLMSYNRYILLNKCIHFVDNTADTNQQLLQNEGASSVKLSARLAKVAPIIVHLGEKFESLYNLGPNVSIDESLTLFKGRLTWAQTIRSKSARFGIKSYELCESSTGYMARFQIYTGKSDGPSVDPSLGVNLGGESTKVVLELLQGLERRGHCVVMDNFYNCPSLARYLKSLGFDCLGTLRVCRRNVPSDIAKVPRKVSKGTIVSRHCGDVSIIAWMDSKMVNIISTYHHPDTYRGTKGGKMIVKPVCVRDYNKSMGGVDLKDQKLSMYLLERKRGLKWYHKIFKRLMNVSIHNALVLYASCQARRGIQPVGHREFRFELADSLLRRHRPRITEISRPISGLMRLRRDIVHDPEIMKGSQFRRRCMICYRMKKTKLIHSKCVQCDVYVCFPDCWRVWHTAPELPGEDIRGRKRRRADE